MIVVVAGASGFVGTHLVRELLSRGHRVRAFVRDAAKAPGRGHPRLETFRGDVFRPETVAKACRGADVYVHAVGASGPDVAGGASATTEAAGVTCALAAAAGVGTPCAAVVNSALLLGPTDRLGAATARTRPFTADYVCREQRNKLAVRDAVRAARRPGFAVAQSFVAPLVGPSGPAPRGWVRALLDAASSDGLPVWPRELGRKFSLARVEDVAAAHALLLESGRGNDEYVFSGEPATFETLLGAGARATLRRGPDVLVRAAATFDAARRSFLGAPPVAARELAEILLHDWAFDASRAETELGARFRAFVDAVAPTVAAGA